MNEASKKMTEGSLWKGIFLFSIPLILSNLLQVLFNMSDIAVIGRFSGPIALGAVGSTATLVSLFIGFLIGLGNGVNVIVARYFGAKDYKGLHHTVHSAFVICLIMGLIIFFLGFFTSKYLLILLKTKEELMDGAVLYLKLYFIGMPGLALYNYGNACYSAMGNTKKPLIFLAIAGVVNIALNLILVIVCKLDVAGVGIASAVSQYVSAALIITSLLREKSEMKLVLKDIRIYKGYGLPIIELGLPSGLQTAIFSIANLFIQAGVNSFDTVMVQGNSAALNADAIAYDAMAAFYVACASFMGQNYGAGKKKRVLHSYYISLIYSFVIGAIIGLSLVVFGKPFLSLFTKDEAVRDAGMMRLKIMGLSYAVSCFMDCSIAASRGLGKSLIPTIIVITGSCVFRVAWVYTIFAHYQTIESLYLVYIFSWVITGIAEIAYFIYVYHKQMGKIQEIEENA